MSGCMLLALASKLRHMFDLSMLTSFTVFDSILYLVQGMASTAELCNLTHFRCSTVDSMSSQHSDDFYTLFAWNNSLEHVYLSISWIGSVICLADQPELEHTPTAASILWPLRHRLRSLVWHEPGDVEPDEFADQSSGNGLTARSFDCTCGNFPRL
jgi:hypothetical protein